MMLKVIFKHGSNWKLTEPNLFKNVDSWSILHHIEMGSNSVSSHLYFTLVRDIIHAQIQ